MESKTINLSKLIKIVNDNKKTYIFTCAVVFAISAIVIFSMPRYYSCSIKLAPEIETLADNYSVSSLTSLIVGSNPILTSDAISPTLYPDLTKSNDFIVGLFDVKVFNKDKDVNTSYFSYLDKFQEKPWWGNLFGKDKKEDDGLKANPFQLTKHQTEIASIIKNKIKCSVDQKTSVITITATDNDAFIAATMADTVRCRLQLYITKYRTSKAHNDVVFYEKLVAEAKHDYERARQLYGSFSDANSEIILQSYKSKLEDYENEMQLKYNNYSTMTTLLQSARTRLQEKTPAFTILQCATVPDKPAGPKRVIFILASVFVASIVLSLWLMRKDIKEIFA